MNILILGSGGREHARGPAVQQKPKTRRLIAAPGLRQALIVSALANGASAGLGLLLDAFGIV